MTVTIGQPAPDFELYSQDRDQIGLEYLKGSKSLIVFMPFPFTGVCTAEACMLRDETAALKDLDAGVVIITTHAVPTNKKWADENGLEFPVLSDFWPHGEVAQAYGTFNDKVGAANRYTFVLDADGIVRDVINTDSLGTAREFQLYTEALAAI
jgi:peroxiredoxin